MPRRAVSHPHHGRPCSLITMQPHFGSGPRQSKIPGGRCVGGGARSKLSLTCDQREPETVRRRAHVDVTRSARGALNVVKTTGDASCPRALGSSRSAPGTHSSRQPGVTVKQCTVEPVDLTPEIGALADLMAHQADTVCDFSCFPSFITQIPDPGFKGPDHLGLGTSTSTPTFFVRQGGVEATRACAP